MNTDNQLNDFVDETWLTHDEGQLSVDVIETDSTIVVRSAIAGVKSEDLDITLTEDTITIRGERSHHCNETNKDQVHVQECHWGSFSRSIILPSHIDPDTVDATLKRGILTIVMNKVEMDKKVHVVDIN
jgi:HSP20 family protein